MHNKLNSKFTKVMRKQILEALKAKFEGVSDAVLGRIADKLAKTVTSEEQVATAVEGVTIQQVIENYADSRATEAQQTAVRSYEKKYGLKDGAKVEGGAPTNEPKNNGGNDDVPAWAQAIIDSNKSLTERLDKMDGERTTATRKQQLAKIIEKLPETHRKAYERISLDTLSDEEFATLQTEVTAEVSAIVAENKSRGAVFGRPVNNSTGKNGGGSEKEATDEEAQAVVDKLSI